MIHIQWPARDQAARRLVAWAALLLFVAVLPVALVHVAGPAHAVADAHSGHGCGLCAALIQAAVTLPAVGAVLVAACALARPRFATASRPSPRSRHATPRRARSPPSLRLATTVQRAGSSPA